MALAFNCFLLTLMLISIIFAFVTFNFCAHIVFAVVPLSSCGLSFEVHPFKIEAFSQACLKHSKEKELNVIWLEKFAFHLKPHAQTFLGLIPPCLDIVVAWLPEIVECGA